MKIISFVAQGIVFIQKQCDYLGNKIVMRGYDDAALD